jgi:GWxTD domain-containing protein
MVYTMIIKKIVTLLICFYSTSIFAIDSSISHAVFKTPVGTPYVEVYIYVLGSTVSFLPLKDSSDRLQAKLNVTILLRKDERIAAFEKYRLSSPITTKAIHFSDLKRLNFTEGEYKLEVIVQDESNPTDTITYHANISSLSTSKISQSDIQLLGSFSLSDEVSPFVKQGIFMETLPYNYYNKKYSLLTFYNEVYSENNNEDEAYVYKYAIHKANGSEAGQELIAVFKKRVYKETDPVLYQMDISKLGSGNYFLVSSLLNKDKVQLSSKQISFTRSNPEFDYQITLGQLQEKVIDPASDFTVTMDSVQLRYSLRALMPVIQQSETEVLKIVISQRDPAAMRRFLYNYYASLYPKSPGASHDKYMEVARAIDKMYNNGFGHGFETDRGYFFLKYGKPDDIQTVNDDPTAPPYEIWFYNKLVQTNQSNVKFIFYNPSLASNGHVLLHSTARGEWNNPKWEVMLYRNAPDEMEGDNYLDGTRMRDNWNRNARRFYDDF